VTMNATTRIGGPAFPIPVLLFTAMLAVRLILIPLHVDRLPVIDSWLKPGCIVAGSVAGLVSFVLAVYLWIKTPPNKLRRNHAGLWGVSVAVSAAICGAVGSWVTVGLLGVGAQYLGGRTTVMFATVTRLDPPSSPRSLCDEHLNVQRNGDNEAIHMCLHTQFLHSLATGVLRPGERVKIRFKGTPLGDVVESIEPTT
jgi:hypothetical protein